MRWLAPAILILALLHFSSASVEWSYSAQSAISGKPIIFSDNVVFSAFDGKVYSFSASSGAISWAYEDERNFAVPAAKVSSDAFAVANNAGRLVFLSSVGKENAFVELGFAPLYLAGDAGAAYLSFKNGVRAYSSSGSSLWNFSLESPAGPVSVQGGKVYFTSGRMLYSLSAKTGAQNWAVPAEDSFQSAAIEKSGSVYFGAVDGRLYSFDASNGRRRWFYQTEGYVQSTPLRLGDSIYFGSNDGSIYSVSDSGKLRFSKKTGEGVWSEPVPYSGGGRQVVVFGSNDGNVYGLDASTGEQVWSFSAGGRVGSIAEKSGSLFFGTSRGRFYSLSPSPICSFHWPKNGDVVGDWPVTVEGTAYADSSVRQVEVRLEGGSWQVAEGKEQWSLDVDFTSQAYGASDVECRVTDSYGNRQDGDYSSIILVKAQNVPLQQMAIISPSEAAQNGTISISAKDSRGEDLKNLDFTIDGAKKTADSPYSFSLGRSGAVPVLIEKHGFEPVSYAIYVAGEGNSLFPVLALAVLAALAFFAYRKFFAKKK
jgi:outer membrane protein assembly factor BamB